MDRLISDTQAMDAITNYLNQPGPWNGGDVCDFVAEVVSQTGRPILDNADEEDDEG